MAGAVGNVLGRYEVVKLLARGGMGDLWLARSTGIGGFERHVVIKQLAEQLAEQTTFVEMFITEARLAGALHHHNIVQVHDTGEADGKPYFAMEYVHGEDLRRLLACIASRKERLPLQHLITIGVAVAAALHHAHEQKGSDRTPLGIVHRDVSPANILVCYDGNVKVADFGIAKAAMTVVTQTGVLKGRAPYMAPEQCSGHKVDRRSDVFALGIVLYELATGRRLFKGSNDFFVMSAIVHAKVPRPSLHRPDLPKELENIILMALERSPSARYQTAEQLGVALDDVAAKAGLRSSPTALADYMKLLFGERVEPWLLPSEELPDDTVMEFDESISGLATPPPEALESLLGDTTMSAPIEHARQRAITGSPPVVATGVPSTITGGQTAKRPPKPSPSTSETATLPLGRQTVDTGATKRILASSRPDTEPLAPPAISMRDPTDTVRVILSPSLVMNAVPPPLPRRPAIPDRPGTDLDEPTDAGEPATLPKPANPRHLTQVVKALPAPTAEARGSTDDPPRVWAGGTLVAPLVPWRRRRAWVAVALGGLSAIVAIAVLVAFTGDDATPLVAPHLVDRAAPPRSPPRDPTPEPSATPPPPPPVEARHVATLPDAPPNVDSPDVETSPPPDLRPEHGANLKPVIKPLPKRPTPRPKPVARTSEHKPVISVPEPRIEPQVDKPAERPATTEPATKPGTWDPNKLFPKKKP